MRIVCACCGSTVAVDQDAPTSCPLCGRRAWQLVQPRSGPYDVSAADEQYLKKIGITWASREDG